jgi:hypothetical protein
MKPRKHKSENKNTKESQSEMFDQSFRDLEDLAHEELSGGKKTGTSAATSSTDEDENEGLGDGNIGRSRANILSK